MLEQFGFKPKHASQQELPKVVEFISEKLNIKFPGAANF